MSKIDILEVTFSGSKIMVYEWIFSIWWSENISLKLIKYKKNSPQLFITVFACQADLKLLKLSVGKLLFLAGLNKVRGELLYYPRHPR